MVFVWTAISLSLTAVALWMSCAQIFSITSYVLQILHLHKKCAVVSRHRRSYVRWIFVTINPSDCTFHICFSLYISFHVVSFVQISNIFLSFFRFYLFPLLCLPSLFSLVEIRYSFSVNGFALLFSRCTKKFTFTQSSVSCCFCGKEEEKKHLADSFFVQHHFLFFFFDCFNDDSLCAVSAASKISLRIFVCWKRCFFLWMFISYSCFDWMIFSDWKVCALFSSV